MTIDIVKTGNEPYIRLTILAPMAAALAESTAVTFTRLNPDASTDTASSPHAKITGPTVDTTVVRGVTVARTIWTWHPPIFTQPGRSTIRARSTAGILCSEDKPIFTPPFAPFATP